MPRNRIPRTSAGDRDWTRLTSNERIVLAALYRQPDRTAQEISAATALSMGQLSRVLKDLRSPRRCGPLGVPAVVLRLGLEGEISVYRVSAAWMAAHRVPARLAA